MQNICFPALFSVSEADMTYQDRLGSDDSDASFYSTTSPKTSSLQDKTLQTVIIHRPDCPQNLQDSPGPSRTPSPRS